jgi:hypothetical protein
MNRTNFAPRLRTIIVALVLMVVGMLGTFVGALPELGGLTSQTLGVWAFLVAAVVVLAGIVFEGI